jgi:hypothetical protein
MHPLTTSLLAELPGLSADQRHQRLQAIGRLPGDEAATVALEILENMDEGTGVLAAMACADTLQRLGRPDQLERLRAVRATVPSFGGLRDWRADIDGALAAVEAVAQQGCRCKAVHANNTAPWGPEFEQLERVEEEYVSVVTVRCVSCGQTYRVTVDDSYHYPMFSWH